MKTIKNELNLEKSNENTIPKKPSLEKLNEKPNENETLEKLSWSQTRMKLWKK